VFSSIVKWDYCHPTDLPTSITITTLPSNNTILRGAAVSLKCTTDANPDADNYRFYLNDNLIGNRSSGVFNTTVMADGVYTCVPVNKVGARDNATVKVTAVGKYNAIGSVFQCYHLLRL